MRSDLINNGAIRLRAPEPEDLDFMLSIENDTQLWEHGGATGPYSRYQLKQFIAESQNDLYTDRQLRLMIEKDGEGTVGMVDLIAFDPRNRRAEVGIVVSGECRGKGIGKAALALLHTHCFGLLGLHQLYAYILSENAPCMALFASAGYVQSGTMKDWMYVNGRYADVCVMQKFSK